MYSVTLFLNVEAASPVSDYTDKLKRRVLESLAGATLHCCHLELSNGRSTTKHKKRPGRRRDHWQAFEGKQVVRKKAKPLDNLMTQLYSHQDNSM